MLVSQKYRAWSDCSDVQAGLALYRWQRQITFGEGGIRVNALNCLLAWYYVHLSLQHLGCNCYVLFLNKMKITMSADKNNNINGDYIWTISSINILCYSFVEEYLRCKPKQNTLHSNFAYAINPQWLLIPF